MFLLALIRGHLRAVGTGIGVPMLATPLFCIVALAPLVSVVGCGHRDKENISGTWMEPPRESSDAPIRFTEVRFKLTFLPDNRVVAEHVRSINGQVIRQETGTYTVEGDEINVNITSGRMPGNYTLKRTGDRLKRETVLGETIEYIRTDGG